MKSVPVEKWENPPEWEKKIIEAIEEELSDKEHQGCDPECYARSETMLKPIREAVSQAIQAARIEAKEEERKRIAGEVSAMFSVYPDGGIHDFGPDEELVSKRSVLSIINKHQ